MSEDASATVRLSDLTVRYPEDGGTPVSWGLFREVIDPEVVAHLTIPGEPVSKARARFTKQGSKIRTFTPEKTRTAEETVATHFRRAQPGWKTPTEGDFGVIAVFFCHTFQRRDVDNMLKLVLDACNKVVWLDDAQVTEVSGRVVRGVPEARSEIAIYRTWGDGRPERACKHCGKRFRIYSSTQGRNQRFCSRDCSYVSRRAKRCKTCPVCQTEFHPQPGKPLEHCSRECYSASRNVQVSCVECGSEFTKPQSLVKRGNAYCSDACKAAFWRKQRAKSASGTCLVCQGPTSKKTYMRCNACMRVGLASPAEVLLSVEPLASEKSDS